MALGLQMTGQPEVQSLHGVQKAQRMKLEALVRN
jgi:hypothetical protein